jgi:hypothetical protein
MYIETQIAAKREINKRSGPKKLLSAPERLYLSTTLLLWQIYEIEHAYIIKKTPSKDPYGHKRFSIATPPPP